MNHKIDKPSGQSYIRDVGRPNFARSSDLAITQQIRVNNVSRSWFARVGTRSHGLQSEQAHEPSNAVPPGTNPLFLKNKTHSSASIEGKTRKDLVDTTHDLMFPLRQGNWLVVIRRASKAGEVALANHTELWLIGIDHGATFIHGQWNQLFFPTSRAPP